VPLAVAAATRALNLTGTFAEAGNPYGNLDNIKVIAQGEGGNCAAYLAARLKKAGRDDLLEQVGPKKPYRSIRAAAIEAGIIKPVPTGAPGARPHPRRRFNRRADGSGLAGGTFPQESG
jgi:hypothetical protein